jgi:hypothetical protein
MINHVVLFKLKEFQSANEKSEALDTFKSKLLNLKNFIPELKYIEVGISHPDAVPSFDLCLITHFENLGDLEVYKVHPEHMKVVEFVKQVTTDRAAVDYEF